ncbi:MAG: D-TA family PLP-dependent enzyme [Planctomyces sp.]|nr:D-TA family PLP-dependent enzyme [Planctomyces sp.]
MSTEYHLTRPDDLLSPALIVFQPILERNLEAMLRLAGSPDRLRPHCKTHKMPAIARRMLELGITRHKAATIAEAEMLALSGATDIVLAYNPVGPNIGRVIAFRQRFPDVEMAVTADHPWPLAQLSAAARSAAVTVGVLMDVNPGRNRTGLPPGPEAADFYRRICDTPGISPAGFHLYDGHFVESDLDSRKAAVAKAFAPAAALRDELERGGCPVPRVLCGGTPTFPVYAARDEPWIELCPGTCTFHDASYGEKFPDLDMFTPAALLLTRVVSRPTPNRITLDLGSKAIAADPPMDQRAVFPQLPDATIVLHNEEHMVVETPDAERFQPGDWLLAIPRHVCPCSALYREAYVIAHGDLVDRWEVAARDRRLTV